MKKKCLTSDNAKILEKITLLKERSDVLDNSCESKKQKIRDIKKETSNSLKQLKKIQKKIKHYLVNWRNVQETTLMKMNCFYVKGIQQAVN